MVALGGLGQQNDLVPKNIEEAGPDEERLNFSVGRRDGKPPRPQRGDKGRMIDQDPEASGAAGGNDRPDRAVEEDPIGCNHG